MSRYYGNRGMQCLVVSILTIAITLLIGTIILACSGCSSIDGLSDKIEKEIERAGRTENSSTTDESTAEAPNPVENETEDKPVTLPTGWSSSPISLNLGGSDAGSVEFQTRGITHQSGRNADGAWEYIFFTMHKPRVLLFHAGGSGRKIRFKVDGYPMQMEIASDELPDVHDWKVQWGSGKVSAFLDGRMIATESFNGKAQRAIVGGNDHSKRNFKGEVRLK